MLDLKRRNGFTAADVENVRCDVFQGAFEFAGGGSFGAKDLPQVKEQGDYNLKYLIAAALLDDQLGPAQLEEARIHNLHFLIFRWLDPRLNQHTLKMFLRAITLDATYIVALDATNGGLYGFSITK